ncbi:hypothetical protein [Bartonella sp. AC330YNZD]
MSVRVWCILESCFGIPCWGMCWDACVGLLHGENAFVMRAKWSMLTRFTV